MLPSQMIHEDGGSRSKGSPAGNSLKKKNSCAHIDIGLYGLVFAFIVGRSIFSHFHDPFKLCISRLRKDKEKYEPDV